MPRLTSRTIWRVAFAGLAAVAVAGGLYAVSNQTLGYSGASVRSAALNVASLVVAFLLVAGIGRKTDKS
ncbi:hypothetical protein IP86_19740 [Rhodopseudomonas sp. AAP120]|uniref:hypothetical protein n=1 Tax=Rhodopseudomonas sp. AAP120 TaxID=1523430 RepID=UPI0006B9F229|nr:hypothetical protein [Rhodopseudomonas sp. AAP120]KPF95210.1 hypothetical protein IP86_19740 [Rhodopseudomonas sp. AAP120]